MVCQSGEEVKDLDTYTFSLAQSIIVIRNCIATASQRPTLLRSTF